MTKVYKLAEIVHATGANRKTLMNLLEREGLTGMPKTEGKGDHRKFTFAQAMKLAICGHITQAGFTIKEAAFWAIAADREAHKQQRTHGQELYHHAYLQLRDRHCCTLLSHRPAVGAGVEYLFNVGYMADNLKTERAY